MPQDTGPEVEARLREIMARHAGDLVAARSGSMGVGYETRAIGAGGAPVWFGGVRAGKAYVSYHLMPVYAFPDLLADVSPGLRKRMQGKSCFNFTKTDDVLFAELDRLTARVIERFRAAGFLEPGARILRDGSVERQG